MALPGSGELSIGMLNFEIASGDSGTTRANETETSQGDMAALAANYSANAESEGEEGVSRANLLAGPYGMDEFYGYTYNACVLVGTEIFMANGSVRFVEDLLIGDEVLSICLLYTSPSPRDGLLSRMPSSA